MKGVRRKQQYKARPGAGAIGLVDLGSGHGTQLQSAISACARTERDGTAHPDPVLLT